MIDGGKAACSVSGGEISGKAMLCGDWQETKVRACRSDTGGKGVGRYVVNQLDMVHKAR